MASTTRIHSNFTLVVFIIALICASQPSVMVGFDESSLISVYQELECFGKCCIVLSYIASFGFTYLLAVGGVQSLKGPGLAWTVFGIKSLLIGTSLGYALPSRNRTLICLCGNRCTKPATRFVRWHLWVFTILVSIFCVLVCACCCFDADATVWRRDKDGRSELVALRELGIEDPVLSMHPWTRQTYWQPVLAKAHFHFLDGGHQLSSMRTLTLEANVARITLSHTHFIFVLTGEDDDASPVQALARDVRVGDRLLYHSESCNRTTAVRVAQIEPHVMRQKRAFFLRSPFVSRHLFSLTISALPAVRAGRACVLAISRVVRILREVTDAKSNRLPHGIKTSQPHTPRSR